MMKYIEKHRFKELIILYKQNTHKVFGRNCFFKKPIRFYREANLFFLSLFLVFSNYLYCQQIGIDLPPQSNEIIPAINFKDTDIRDVLRSIAYDYKTNIVVENDITSKVSVALFNVSVFNAVKVISEDNGFEFSYDSLRFYVKTKKSPPPPPPPPAPPENHASISYSRGKLSINSYEVDISDFVDSLRSATGINFLISAGTSGRVTGRLTNIDFRSGLSDLLMNNGFYLTEKDSIYYISRSHYYSSLDNTTNKVRGTYWVSAQNNKITMDVTDASVGHIIDDIANQLNLQVVKLKVTDSNVTVKCSDVSVETAFDYLFAGTDYSYRKDGDAYIIGDKKSQSVQNTKLIKLLYLRADKFKETIPQEYSKNTTIGVSIEHNALIVTGSSEDIDKIKNYVSAVDKPVPQVMIEALVVDYNLTNSLQLGFTAGSTDSASAVNAPNSYYPGINVTASGAGINKFLSNIGKINIFGKDIDVGKLGKLPNDFFVNLKAMEDEGIANVESRPILSTLNGYTASLKIGTVQNYVFNDVVPIQSAVSTTYIQKEEIQKIEANISFEITPWVGPNNELTLEIKPNFQTPVGQFSPDKNLIPAINTRSMTSTVRIKDGETIILGGLIQDSENNTEDKLPIIGDIPILGSLFTNTNKSKTKGELMIYITPHISYGDDLGNLYYNYSR